MATENGRRNKRGKTPTVVLICLSIVLPMVFAVWPLMASHSSTSVTPSQPHVFSPSAVKGVGAVAACSSIESNASLAGAYDSAYQGIPTAVQAWSSSSNRSNLTEPANQSAYPNSSIGGAQLISAWTAICQSSAFALDYGSHGLTNFSMATFLNGSTGYFNIGFGFQWAVSCASSGDPNAVCQTGTTWLVNLASGKTNGPYSVPLVAIPIGPPPPTTSGPKSGGHQLTLSTTGVLEIFAVASLLGALTFVGLRLRIVRARQSRFGIRKSAHQAAHRESDDRTRGLTSDQDTSEDPLSDIL